MPATLYASWDGRKKGGYYFTSITIRRGHRRAVCEWPSRVPFLPSFYFGFYPSTLRGERRRDGRKPVASRDRREARGGGSPPAAALGATRRSQILLVRRAACNKRIADATPAQPCIRAHASRARPIFYGCQTAAASAVTHLSRGTRDPDETNCYRSLSTSAGASARAGGSRAHESTYARVCVRIAGPAFFLRQHNPFGGGGGSGTAPVDRTRDLRPRSGSTRSINPATSSPKRQRLVTLLRVYSA